MYIIYTYMYIVIVYIVYIYIYIYYEYSIYVYIIVYKAIYTIYKTLSFVACAAGVSAVWIVDEVKAAIVWIVWINEWLSRAAGEDLLISLPSEGK